MKVSVYLFFVKSYIVSDIPQPVHDEDTHLIPSPDIDPLALALDLDPSEELAEALNVTDVTPDEVNLAITQNQEEYFALEAALVGNNVINPAPNRYLLVNKTFS